MQFFPGGNIIDYGVLWNFKQPVKLIKVSYCQNMAADRILLVVINILISNSCLLDNEGDDSIFPPFLQSFVIVIYKPFKVYKW